MFLSVVMIDSGNVRDQIFSRTGFAPRSGRVRVRVRQAVRGCVLEGDADAAARGVFDGLFGLVVEVVAHQAATGRCKGWVQRERAGVSMGADTKANTIGWRRT